MSTGESAVACKEERRGSDPENPGGIDTPDFQIGNVSMAGVGGRLKIPLKHFDGSTCWKDFARQFQRASRVNGWREEDLQELLCLHLEGSALEYIDSLPEVRVNTLDKLTEALENRFGAARMSTVYKAELDCRRRKEAEAIPDLGQDIRRLVQYAYPGLDTACLEELAVDRFIAALREKEHRLLVRQGRPRTLDQAVQQALDLEAWELSEEVAGGGSRRARAAGVESAGPAEAKMMDALKEIATVMGTVVSQLSTMTEKMATRAAEPPRPRTCFGCKQPGHFLRDCPQRQSGNAQQSQ